MSGMVEVEVIGASAVPTFDSKLKGPLATVEDYFVDLGGSHANFAQLTLLRPLGSRLR